MEEKAIGRITEHVVCGADGWSDVALFGKSKLRWFKTILELRAWSR